MRPGSAIRIQRRAPTVVSEPRFGSVIQKTVLELHQKDTVFKIKNKIFFSGEPPHATAHLPHDSRQPWRTTLGSPAHTLRGDHGGLSQDVTAGLCSVSRQPLAGLSQRPSAAMRIMCGTCCRTRSGVPCAPVRHSMANAIGNMCGARAAPLLSAGTLIEQPENFEFSSFGQVCSDFKIKVRYCPRAP
ncbi:peptidylprolyl isomerase (ISS) [Dorcoceras hygrometricum]|uniref:Peptidylprolyl isomerase (ISS) n=1 Tax=Dorcoceras hygrometricum TaxID=472368 RepID=A0A2Z7D5M1_9LAMI|nr:peptidylprolyl isomerase (ISS) [Dorcoceras hygrometricum]